jgi:hypothetical protein
VIVMLDIMLLMSQVNVISGIVMEIQKILLMFVLQMGNLLEPVLDQINAKMSFCVLLTLYWIIL